MWMAAGFAMLEAGLVRSKNTTEILTKNIALFAIASIMYLLRLRTSCTARRLPAGLGFLIGSREHAFAGERGLAGGGRSLLLGASDFFFQVVFVATAMSIVSGAVAERMKLWAFLAFAVVMTGFIYPMQGYWTWGGGFLNGDLGFSDFAGSGIVHMAGAPRRWPACCCSARARASTARTARSTPSPAPTCRWPRWAPSSCGWAGSASTAAPS
jgi:ammonium transporter, Amt family